MDNPVQQPRTCLTGAARSALDGACSRLGESTMADDVDGVHPEIVAWACSTEEVSEILRASAAHGLSVVARGRGTKLTWGRPPATADVLLDVSSMDQVIEHAAGDLVVATQAGTPLADVQAVVSSAQQRLAIDQTVPGESIGGALACNTSGPRRMSVGTMRDLLIGITVVRPDGVVAKAGGRVVKNVAGYDLGKLMIGSFGTLAVVTEALFRLHPIPTAQRFVSVPVDTAEQVHRVVQRVLGSQIVPIGLEVNWPPEGSGTLTLLLEGSAAGVSSRMAAALQLLGDHAWESTSAPDGWSTYPWPLDCPADRRSTALKLTFALSGLEGVLTAVRSSAVPIALRGSVGAGVLYGAIPPSADVTAVSNSVRRLRSTCVTHGGSVVVVDGAPQVKQTVDSWGRVPALELMRRVKDRFDPDRRLARGRFVGGI
jgi:glycolate oxidase FAD binding subunit